MRRSILITAGAVVIILVLLIWVYLMLFGSPTNRSEIFTNLGFDISPQPVAPVVEATEESDTRVDVATEKLQQLTTRPVAGFVGLSHSSTSDPRVRYAEQGTGHIYEINLRTGEEEMISRTTLPRVQLAAFSADGSLVALTAITGYTHDTLFGKIDENNTVFNGENIPPDARNVFVTDEGTVRFTRVRGDDLIGYEQTLGGTITELFGVPFHSVRVLWEHTPTLLYNRPADSLQGYVYEVDGINFSTTPIHGYGLVAESLGNLVGYTILESNDSQSSFFDTNTKETYLSPLPLIPEKCDYHTETNRTICAAPIADTVAITDWYKGINSSNDVLWEIDVVSEEATLLENLPTTAGRPLDVWGLKFSNNDDRIFFMNKQNHTLWQYVLD